MLMPDHMNMPWPMGRIERLEMTFFWIVAIAVIVVLITSAAKSGIVRKRVAVSARDWRTWPE